MTINDHSFYIIYTFLLFMVIFLIYTVLFGYNTVGSTKPSHYENTPIQITENFTTQKMKVFTQKFWYFFIFLLKI